MSAKILFIDDDANLLAAFQRTLRKNFALEVAAGPREALELIKTAGPFAVVVADMRMPGMDGLTLLEHLTKIAPDTVRIMLTGNPDQATTMAAINRGHVSRFLSKPCPPEVLVPVLQEALQQYLRVTTERSVLESTLTQCVQSLAQVFGMTMPDAHERGECLRSLVREFAIAAGVGPLWELETAALLSPIGLAALPTEVVRKVFARVTLSPEEAAIARRVPKVGHDLLRPIPRLENVARTILYQDKNFDGSGFPDDPCKEDEIPIGARLLKIVHDRLELEADGKMGPTAHTIMSERFGVYDYRLLAPCFARFPAMLRPRLDGEKAPRMLALSELEPGQRLYTDIVTSSGFVVAATSHQLTGMVIERLANLVELGEVREPFQICDDRDVVSASMRSAPEV